MSGSDLIAGRYRIEGRLGSGGMSTVHLATDERLERKVAVKLLAEHLADDPAFVSRFRHEALAAARLVHPHVVQVFDFGLDESSSRHFIVMEHVAGASCSEILRDRGSLAADEVSRITSDAAEGLGYAHRHGVIHRDVKPGNLLVAESGRVKLADFGIAKATEQSSVTQVGSVLGTAAYLAPEQARGADADPRCDIYALGVVAYQLASGKLPYEATSLSELVLIQQQGPPPRLDQVDPAIPAGLANVVESALSPDPDMRPQDANELAAMLRGGQDGLATAATRVVTSGGGTGPATAATHAATTMQRQARPPRQASGNGGAPARRNEKSPAKRKGPRRLALAVVVIALLAAGAGVAIWASGGANPSLQQVDGNDAQQAIQSMRDLISNNTR